MSRLKTLSSSFIPVLVSVLIAAGLCLLLLRGADSFEDSFLKIALSDIKLRTEG